MSSIDTDKLPEWLQSDNSLADALRSRILSMEQTIRLTEGQQEDAKVEMLSQLRLVDERYRLLLEQADRYLDTFECTLHTLREKRSRVQDLATTNRQTLRRLEHVLSTPPTDDETAATTASSSVIV